MRLQLLVIPQTTSVTTYFCIQTAVRIRRVDVHVKVTRRAPCSRKRNMATGVYASCCQCLTT